MTSLNYFFVLLFAGFSNCASISKNDTLEVLKKDVAHVGSALEDFTFDVLRSIIQGTEETTEAETFQRRKRSAEDEMKQLCQKRCEEAQRIETRQIQDLKIEVKKLQQMVKLLQDQKEVIDTLDKNSKTERNEKDESPTIPNSEALLKIKLDLKEVIVSLNETREIMDLQKQKDEILEEELMKQKDEISELRKIVNRLHNQTHTESRSSGRDLSTIRKLLKSLPDDDDDDLSSKLEDLQKHLSKKRKQQSLLTELKQLEKSIDEENSDSDLLRQIIRAIKKSEPQDREDSDITNLEDLQEAINRLKPKENEASQFQAVLTKLIRPQNQVRPNFVPPPMTTKKLAPYMCVVDDGTSFNAAATSKPLPEYNRQQFFPGQYSQQSFYPQKNVNGNSAPQSGNYQKETDNQKYQQDLRQQIDGLQSAIDNLNRPEYGQRPEDKAVIDDLEKQISELRGVVDTLNYDAGPYRSKRSLENNEVEISKEEIAEKVKSLVDEILKDKNETKSELDDIQNRINKIKEKLPVNGTNPRSREAISPFDTSDLTRSFKGDFLAEIISKILEKIISAVPAIVKRLFNFSFEELSKTGYDYDAQVLYKNLGIFAYLPVILLRILKGLTSFLNMLRKNSFFKTFLVPAIILGTVAGSVLFLIWWLQPDESYNTNYYNYATDQNYQSDPNQYNQNSYQYSNTPSTQSQVSYNYPLYNRSYFNK